MMLTALWFEDFPVLGLLEPDQAAAKLREFGDDDLAQSFEEAAAEGREADLDFAAGRRWPFRDKPWQYTAHAFGYLAPGSGVLDFMPLRHAGTMEGDPTLKGKRLKITLDCLRVASYPGRGIHRILFDFYAQNQVPGTIRSPLKNAPTIHPLVRSQHGPSLISSFLQFLPAR